MPSPVVENVCGWIGAVIAIYFYLSPIVPIMNLIKKKIQHDNIPGILLLCTLVNCIVWGDFGLQLSKIPIWLCNTVGGVGTLVFLAIYWTYFAEQKLIPSLVYNVIMFNAAGEIFYICYIYGGEKYNYIVGYVGMVINVLMYAAPGEKIFRVIKTGDFTLIPIFSCIGGAVGSGFWGIYGFAINEITMIIPNCLGLIFAFLQIGSYLYFKRKPKDIPQLRALVDSNLNTNSS